MPPTTVSSEDAMSGDAVSANAMSAGAMSDGEGLADPFPYRFALERRTFLRVVGGGLLVAIALADARESDAQESGSAGRGARGRGEARELAAWLHIDERGAVTAYTGKVEIGQNIRTSLAQAVADELRVPIEAVTMVMADTELTPYDAGTFGSQTTPRMARQLARAAVTAREMLVDRAAARWQVDRATLTAKDGRITDAGGRTLSYGDLTQGQKLTGLVTEEAAVAPPDAWTLRGTPVKKVNGRAIVTGQHPFTPDIVRPQMQYGRIVRPDRLGATAMSVDDSRARSLPGVTIVRDGDLLGVVAPSERLAARAAALVRVEWRAPATGPGPSSETIFDHLRNASEAATPRAATGASSAATPGAASGTPGAPSSGARGATPATTVGASDTTSSGAAPGAATSASGAAPAPVARAQPPAFVVGDVAQGRAGAAHTLEATYKIPYIAHVPLEPRTAIAEWTDGRLTAWVGTQRPFGVRSELAQAFHLPEERVRVIAPDMGSAYGGKHSGEHAVEAARLAKAAGRPVKLVWTRAEEFTWGYFRPAGVIAISSAIDANGRIMAWEHDNWNSGASGIRTPYDVPHQRIAFHPSASPLRQGSYRGLAATANHYAREMHMDAIARKVGADAVEFRLRHLKDERMRAVLTAAAERAGWQKGSAHAAKDGRAWGIACGTEKGSYVATAAELSKTADGFRVERLVVTFECGAIVNPDGLRNQVDGSIVQGLGGALFEAITFADGRILNGTLAQYRVPRFLDVPPIDTILLNRPDLPSAGAGETPIICVAPAIGSAARGFGPVAPALPIRFETHERSRA